MCQIYRNFYKAWLDWPPLSRLFSRLESIEFRKPVALRDSESQLRWGILRGSVYIPVNRDAGFFSLCSTVLSDIASLKRPVRRIVARSAFTRFKAMPGIDSWSVFFERPYGDIFPDHANVYVADLVLNTLHHSNYLELNYSDFAPYVNRYFRPSKRVRNRLTWMVEQNSISLENTIAVNIRGTDKWKELEASPLENYLSITQKLSISQPLARILLVTDQREFFLAFSRVFGDRLIVIPELPTVEGTENPVHKVLRRSERQEFGVNFFATLLLISQAKVVVTHTGNSAFWTALFRGNAKDFIQLRDTETFGFTLAQTPPD